RLAVDAGRDGGKHPAHSPELVRRPEALAGLGYPLLVAPSRQDVVGETLGVPPVDRLEGTLALVALSVWAGASIVRVHDVKATVRTVRMVEAVMGTRAPAAPVRGLWE
ncbi:MAG TPA: dihydropteroate synthase, partial [Actinomycetota bacterium]|nr:dihydropteroate synthase [Actinomycetota bacterium]